MRRTARLLESPTMSGRARARLDRERAMFARLDGTIAGLAALRSVRDDAPAAASPTLDEDEVRERALAGCGVADAARYRLALKKQARAAGAPAPTFAEPFCRCDRCITYA